MGYLRSFRRRLPERYEPLGSEVHAVGMHTHRAMTSPDPWHALSRRVVMVAAYGPRDGIARYAHQLMAAHSGARSFMRVGIPEAPGDRPRALHRGPRALWLLRDARRGDDIVVHYHPDYYIRGGRLSRLASYASWGLLGLLRRLVIVAHEPDPPAGSRAEELVRRSSWRRARTVVFHSGWERDRWRARYGTLRRQTHVVVPPGAAYMSEVQATPAEARRMLGLPGNRVIMLMIGFLSPAGPDKGYDRAIAAVLAAGEDDLELRIVGSPIREGPAVDRLLADLRRAAAEHRQIVLHEEYVDDEAFDLWVRAADAVLAPYRTASSSGVVARARLLGTPVIMSDAGGLPEQAGPVDVVVRDDAELLAAVQQLVDAARVG